MGIFKNIYGFRKLRRELLTLYKEDSIPERFSKLYKVDFKVDRAARMYAIINPLLHNMKTNNASQAYEYTANGMNDYEYIRQWIFTNLLAIAPVMAGSNLLDVLLFDITEVLYDGEKTGNYCITFTPYNFKDYVNSKKKLWNLIWKGLVILAVAVVIGLIIKSIL